MNYTIYFISLLLLASGLRVQAQEKRAMTFDEMVGWERISEQRISDNGKWVFCKMEPWRGDATIRLYNGKGEEKATFKPASTAQFSASSEYLLVTKVPPLEMVETEKRKKTGKDKMPMNSLVIFRLTGGEETVDSLKTYKLSETADWLAYQRGSKKDSILYIRSLDGMQKDSFPAVSDFGFAPKGNVLYFVSDSVLYTYMPKKGNSRISAGKGVFKKIAFDETGSKLAYLFCTDKDSASTRSSLYLAENNAPGKRIVERGDKAFPTSWIISENGTLLFSENANRLFFGTAPEPRQKDTTILAENRPDIQVWSWDEKIQYTQQSFNKAADLKRSYTAVYNIGSGRLFQLATEELPSLQTADEGNASLALLSTFKPYGTQSMWTAKNFYDIYTVDLETGERRQIKEKSPSYMRFSPKGKYTYWYQEQDSSWYTRSMADGKEFRLTTPETFTGWNEDNDVPDYPSPYGIAGWTDDDRTILIRDRYDIWEFSPTASSSPVNLTVNGRKEKISYSLIQLDREKRSYNLSENQYLNGFNEATKGFGYYAARLNKPAAPKALLAGDFKLAALSKAKNADAVIYTQETYEQYPDILLSDLGFKKSIRLTDGIRQQDSIIWGTAELTTWLSLDGRPLEGVIYKPADFDPNKKYPVIVNFYERNANTLYSYHMPSPHRSTIDYPFYLSHGFVIFNPDVRFIDGYPGESCYNCVMPGITSLIAKGYVDEKAIGAQGHSWGGYQVAYLATRTRLFAAIESGAPVVNMLSAYGGIRWGSGLNRSMQYEHGQSRIGGNIWEMPLQYIENSPLFNMDKVTTPILIMHNDADGHVPWYQGIEYFIALKRLQKPAWLLNYTGEPHWPTRLANRIDFQKRMFQFFSHYLQGAPMPQWMSEGVPAVDRDFELGY